MCTDFVSFSLIYHVLVQRCTLVTAVCNLSLRGSELGTETTRLREDD
jgi:hypothetical protein